MTDAGFELTAPSAALPPRREVVRALLVAALIGGLLGAALALVARPGASGTTSLALVATVPVTDHSHPLLTAVSVNGPSGDVLLPTATPTLTPAPTLTDLGVHPVAAGRYTSVTATVNGQEYTVRIDFTVPSDAVTPLLLVVRRDGVTAAAGNDDVNHAALLAAGQLIHPPDVAFVDQNGAPVPFHSLRGRVLVVAALDSHCHDTCPLYTSLWADLQRVIRERGWQDRVAIAEISMDPDRDTPAELTAYGHMVGATWPLLRSDTASTLAFWLSLGATYYKAATASPAPVDWYTGKPETYHLHHDSLAVVFDQHGDARYLLQGNPRLGHTLSTPLAALETGGESGAQKLEAVGSWSLPDLLDRVDTVLGAPLESSRGVENAAEQGRRAPDFSAVGADGAPVSLHTYTGRPVVVTFWATWCGPCKQDMPMLARAVRDHPDLVVLAVDEGESSGQVRSYLHDLLGADAARITAAVDPQKAVGAIYAVNGLPITVFVGADGIVQAVRVGLLQPDDFARNLTHIGA
jgi:cytochrome c biogenesis protein CcmG/thiol:disulfide interchange protein DsbE